MTRPLNLIAPPLLALLPLLLSLGGCAQGNSPQAICERVVNADPRVSLLRSEQAGSPWLLANEQGPLHYAEAQARLRCLRAHGVLPPGGVQAKEPAPLDHTLW